jgi:signal transduction histidine kinase
MVPKFSFRYIVEPGAFYLPSLLFFLAYVTYGLYKLFKAYYAFSGIKANQTKYLFWGSLFGYMGGSLNFLWVFNIRLYPLNPFGIYTVPLYVFVVAYAIIKHRLMDINVAITRGTVFAAVYAFVLAIPLAVGYWGKTYLSDKIGGNWWFVPVGMALLLASLGPTIYGFIRRKTEAALFSERRRYQKNLIALAKQMTLTKDLRSLLVLIIRNVTREIGISHARIYLLDKKADEYVREVCYGKERRRQFGDSLSKDAPMIRILSGSRDRGPLLKEEVLSHFETNEPEQLKQVEAQLRSMGAALLLPAFIGEELVAFLALGTKRSKEMYTPDDLDMFKILAGQAALAVENAQFYQELKESQATILQAAKLSSIGELATGFAHQIDNPLGIISAGCQLCMMDIKDCLKRGNLDENDSKALQAMEDRMQKVIDTAHRGAELVQRIKGYAKPSDRDFEATDLNSIIEDSLGLAQYQISHGAINVIKDIPQNLPKVRGIGVQLEQAFLNMIINACEAMSGKKGELAISARPGKENPNMVEITISDNGRGMPKENLRKIFDIFFTTKGPQETGMGLSMAYRIIKDHNGDIHVDSKVGEGTRFTVFLPIWKEEP